MGQPSSLLKNCSGSRLPLTPGPHSSGSLSAPAWPGAGFLLDISHLPSRPSPSFLPSQPSCPRASVPAHWTADSPVSASPPACPVLSLLAAASWTLAVDGAPSPLCRTDCPSCCGGGSCWPSAAHPPWDPPQLHSPSPSVVPLPAQPSHPTRDSCEGCSSAQHLWDQPSLL